MSTPRCLVCGSPCRRPDEAVSAGEMSVGGLRRLPSGHAEAGRICRPCVEDAERLPNVTVHDAPVEVDR